MAFEFEQEIIEPTNDIVKPEDSHTEEPIPFTYLRKASGELIRLHFGDHPDVPTLNAPIRNGELRK